MIDLPTPKFQINFDADPLAPYVDIAKSFAPVGYWRLGESSGTNADDASDYGLDGTYTGGVTLGAAAMLVDGDTAASFDGTDDWVSVATSTLHQNLVPPWTLAAWIYPTATRSTDGSYAGILTYEFGPGNVPFSLNYGMSSDDAFSGANCVWLGYRRQDLTLTLSVADPTPVVLNTWHHYVGVASVEGGNTYLALYRNGQLVAGPARQSTPALAAASLLNVRIGRRWNAAGTQPFFPGRIDEPMIVDYALSAEDVARLYAGTLSVADKTSTYVEIPPLTGQTTRIRAFNMKKGRQTIADRVEASELTIVLDNTDDALTPDPIVNLLTNPQFEASLTDGWGVVNGTRALDGNAQAGAYSCKLSSSAAGFCYIVTPTSVGLGAGTRPGKTYTFSAHVFVPSGTAGHDLADVALEFGDRVSGVYDWTISSSPGSFDTWLRLSATRTIRSGADAAECRVRFNAGGTGAGFYILIDVMQLEEGPLTTYADGSQTDCRWNGEPHESVTHRKAAGSYRRIIPDRFARLQVVYAGVTYPMIEGLISDIRYDYPGMGRDATVTLRVVDGFQALSANDLSNFRRPAETVPNRVRATLRAAGIPDSKVVIDDALCDSRNLAAIGVGSVSGPSLNYLRQIEESEGGIFRINSSGQFIYEGRLARTLGSTLEDIILTDDDFDIAAYSQIGLGLDDGLVQNELTFTHQKTGRVIRVNEPTSIKRYYPKAVSRTSLYDDTLALYRSRGAPAPIAESLTLKPIRRPAQLWPLLLGLDVSSLARIERSQTREALGGYMQWIEGIEHSASPRDWNVTLHTSAEVATGIPTQTLTSKGIGEPSELVGGFFGFQSGGYATFVIPSATYTAGRLYVLFLAGDQSAAIPSGWSSSGWTQVRSDTHIAGSSQFRMSVYWSIAAATNTGTKTFTSSGNNPTFGWYEMFEVPDGFNASSPIGANNFATGTSNTPTVDIGTFSSVYSRGLAATMGTAGGTASWGRFFEVHDEAGGSSWHWGAAYGPEGTDIFTCTRTGSETFRISGVEVQPNA